MAEPVFEDHPLEAYLRQSGEGVEPMPGSLYDLPVQDELTLDDSSEHEGNIIELLPLPLAHCVELLLNLLSVPKLAAPNREFAERFKYDVISSSLLSSSLSTPVSAKRRSFSPDIRESLSTLDDIKPKSFPASDADVSHPPLTTSPEADSNLSAALLLLAVISLAFGFVLPTILFGTTSYYLRTQSSEAQQSDVSEATLQSLHELVAAANIWDSAVNEAISLIEKEERSIYYGPTSPSSPSSPLRVALHSSLHTTQTQSDNVRPLLAALTAEDELSQLSEMYAPPSPVKLSFGLDQHRPMSLPTARSRTMSSPADKRATWNGSYVALAQHGSPLKLVLKRSEKRRSDLSAVVCATARSAVSEPGTPSPTTQLTGVREEDDGKDIHTPEEAGDDGDGDGDDETQSSAVAPEERGRFGSAALDLRRRHRASGLEALGYTSPTRRASHFPPMSRSSTNANITAAQTTSGHARTKSNTSSFSPSRFTTIQTPRHPLSLSALTHALHGALAAKRYAAAHLLALRFDEDLSENDAYWEDVRAVMGLLTSALADAAARLLEALEVAAHDRLRDATPSPVPMAMQSAPPAMVLPSRRAPFSFAPMPSHLSRFATHVDAISGALNNARDELELCVSALREHPAPPSGDDVGVSAGLGGERPRTPESMQESPALQAYERLRRELGLALRECERGRERLLDILAPPKVAEEHDSEAEGAHGDGVDEDDGLPLLGPDAGSDDSDKTDSLRSHLIGMPEGEGDEDAVLVQGAPGALDDAALLLPLAAGAHDLPPQGIEQVFEADVGSGVPFARERSKLTREERIRMVKARRESGGKGVGLGIRLGGDEEREERELEKRERRGWGPGGDVVEELKDVIWKVGERRRKMAERRLSEECEKLQEHAPQALPSPPALSTLEESLVAEAS